MTPEEMNLLVMREIAQTPEVNQRNVAQRLGISLGKVNFVLRALANKGLVKVDNFRRSDRKLAYAYVLTPAGLEERTRLTMSFLQRKLGEYDDNKSSPSWRKILELALELRVKVDGLKKFSSIRYAVTRTFLSALDGRQ